MIKEYCTVSRNASAEIAERKSRFICSAGPVETEDAALAFIDNIRSRHRDASHNVFAYTAGIDSVVSRFSDDGEPSGTAGMPAMEIINKLGLRNAVLVVTRYFGGIKLGAPGLVRAYSKAASAGIEAAGVVHMALCKEVRVTLPYTMTGRMSHWMETKAIRPESVEYGSDAKYSLFFRADDLETMEREITDLTGSAAIIEEFGMEYKMTI
jgi:uncharacterized YigZ family protein